MDTDIRTVQFGNQNLFNLQRLTFVAEEESFTLQLTACVTSAFPTLTNLCLQSFRIDREMFYRFAGSLKQVIPSPLKIAIDRLCCFPTHNRTGEIELKKEMEFEPDSEWTRSCESYLRSLHMEAGSLGLTRLEFSFCPPLSFGCSLGPEADGFCTCSQRKTGYAFEKQDKHLNTFLRDKPRVRNPYLYY